MAKSKSKSQQTKAPIKPTLPEWPLSQVSTQLVYVLLSAALTLALFSRYLFGGHLFIFDDAGSDPITVFFPNLVHAARYFQEVGIPGWSFYIGLGTNIYPGFLLNPLNWIYLPMDPASIAYTLGWMQAAILFGTGFVFYKLLRAAGLALPVCFVGALAYCFGGYAVLGNTWYGHAIDIFWMTCALLGFEWLLKKKHLWFFPIPFLMLLSTRGYFLILFLAFYALIRMLDVYGGSWREVFHGYKRMILLGIIAFLFALPFIGGKWHKFANSPRVTGNVSYSERLSDQPVMGISIAKHNVTAIMRIFSNDMMGTASDYKGWRNYLEAPCLYIGLITLFMVFQFFVLAERRRKWLYGSLLLFWIFIMIFPWFRYAFYGFAGNYYKGALSLFIPFSFLFVGLLGFQEIVSGKPLNKLVLFLSSLFWLILLWIPYNVKDVNIQPDMQLKVSAFILAYTALLWFMAEGMLKKIVWPALIVVASVEALVLSWPAINDRVTMLKSDIRDKKYHFDDSAEAVASIKAMDKEPFYRIDKVYGSIKTGYNDGMVQGFFGSKTYQSHNHKYYVDFLDKAGVIDGSKEANTRWLVGISATNILHGLFSVKYLMSTEATAAKVDGAIYDPIDTIGSTIIQRNKYYIPFGIPQEEYLSESDLEKLTVNQIRRAFYFSAVGEDNATWKNKLRPLSVTPDAFFGTATRDRTAALAGKAMVMDKFTHNRIQGHIDVPNPSMLFFSIPFDAGWKAKVNGKEQPIEKVNYGFCGVMLEPGSSKIDLRYEPPLSKTGWLGTLASLLGIGLLVFFRKKF